MKIEKSVRKALEEFAKGDLESAMLFTCISIDGTARKTYPHLRNDNRKRFTEFIKSNYDILEEILFSGFKIDDFPQVFGADLTRSRWLFKKSDSDKISQVVDFADIIYKVHRCCHAHGECLPEGFELIPNPNKKQYRLTFSVKPGSVQFSDHIIPALLAITILDPINQDLIDPLLDQYRLPIKGQDYIVNDWWGKRDQVRSLLPEREKVAFDSIDLRN